MIAVTAIFTIKPEPLPDVLPLMRRSADASRDEPACQRFDMVPEEGYNPNETLPSDLGTRRAGLDAQRSIDHFRTVHS